MSPGPNTRRGPSYHVALTVPQVHFPLTPQQSRRGANTVNEMSRRSRTGTRARGISLIFVDEFQAFHMATTKSGQCNVCGYLRTVETEQDDFHHTIRVREGLSK
ncbi:hypothetical protein AVEN_234813-1 [Araneus ventricosus]|uniref:Uncharacterized protein n=1 Tax=Araneus ventricosus TaxID=182803 RepID=A0A4Y2F7S8_ARAVE|nr:hypothetical protein AVEN_234813-1 [Araneus ventricosus]